MRRTVSIILVLAGLFTAVTGIWNFFPPFNESFSPGHAIGGSLVGALCVVHLWFNRKPVAKYMKGLGWWWVLIALGLTATVMVIVIPIVRM